jgi:hypothetical protein
MFQINFVSKVHVYGNDSVSCKLFFEWPISFLYFSIAFDQSGMTRNHIQTWQALQFRVISDLVAKPRVDSEKLKNTQIIQNLI